MRTAIRLRQGYAGTGPADKWAAQSRAARPLKELNLLGHSTKSRSFAEF